MLSYRHAFHAGNHADVLKHTVELLLLDYLNQKDKPYWYIDTHAGAGLYRLDGDYASKSGEASEGVLKLAQTPDKDLAPILQEYLAVVRSFNQGSSIRNYPGSPFISQALQIGRAHV